MAKHLTDRLIRGAIGQSNCSSECMPGNVKGEILGYVAAVSNFLEVRVHFLIGQYREQGTFINALGVVLVLVNNLQRNRKQWNP